MGDLTVKRFQASVLRGFGKGLKPLVLMMAKGIYEGIIGNQLWLRGHLDFLGAPSESLQPSYRL